MKTQNSQKLHKSGLRKIIVVLGPTASGKTGLAQKLCKKFNGCIISADSRQVYRYMDLGTGKVDTLEELADLDASRSKLLKQNIKTPQDYIVKICNIDNYMIDAIRPKVHYNVALYKDDVYKIIKNLDKNQLASVPFLVGGTGLYINAVVENFQFPGGEPDLKLRKKLEQEIAQNGLATVWSKLIKLDPGCKNIVQKENSRRVVRALEFVLSTGKKFSMARKKNKPKFNVLKIGIKRPRKESYKRIDARVDERINLGMVQEVAGLMDEHKVSYRRLQNFGLEYRVISKYLKGGFESVDQMAQRLKWDIHAYFRRQITWFKRDKHINWVKGYKQAEKLVSEFLETGSDSD